MRGVSGRMARSVLIGTAVVGTVAAAAAVGTAAPAPQTTSGKAALSAIGIVTPEKAADYGWNAMGASGARSAAKAVGAKAIVADNSGYDDISPIVRQLKDQGAGLIIGQASGYSTVLPNLARQLRVPVLTVDTKKNITRDLIGNVDFVAQQGAYLAGVLAATQSKNKVLGIATSAENTNWNRMAGGFAAGAKSVSKKIKILQAQIGQAGYADAAGGKRITKTLLAGGADVVFGMGDGSSFGFLQAVETTKPKKPATKAYFIDVIGDKTPIDKKKVLLTSVIWDFAPAFTQAAKDVNANRFGRTNYQLTLANKGIRLLNTKQMTGAGKAAVAKAQKAIVSGKVKVPDTATKAAVNKIVKSK